MQKVKVPASGPKLASTRCIPMCNLQSICSLHCHMLALGSQGAAHGIGMFTLPCSSEVHHSLRCSDIVA